RERFREEVFQLRAVGELLPELRGLAGQLLVRELLDLRLQRVDRFDLPAVLLEKAVVAAAEDGLESVGEHVGRDSGRCGNRPRGSRAGKKEIISEMGSGDAHCKRAVPGRPPARGPKASARDRSAD